MSNQEKDAFVTQEELGRFAVASAAALRPGRPIPTSGAVGAARRDLDFIKSVMRSASSYTRRHVTIPQELEWLLDNWYIAEREGKSAAADMKSARRLRTAGDGRSLLVGEAASLLVSSGLGDVSSERMEVFLDAFQQEVRLTETELSAFIPAVRLALVAQLAGACRRMLPVMAEGAVDKELAPLLGRIFSALRFLSGFDASDILESVNRVERTLRQDPAGVYSHMDEQTRYSYRHAVARLAAHKGDGAHETAEAILEMARAEGSHVGRFIFERPLGRPIKARTGSLYIGLIILGSLFASLLIGFALDAAALAILLLLPVSEIIKNVADYVALRCAAPRRIHRLELPRGVPPEGKTLCAVSVLLSSPESGLRAAGLLEEYRLLNRDAGENLLMGILADLPDNDAETTPDDGPYLEGVGAEVGRLNEKYGGGFFLFCRGRRWNDADKKFMPWERKRGAILELCRFLRGAPSGVQCLAGDPEAAAGARYLIALDSDTRLCAGTARELIGAALHPLNKPVIDGERGIVTSGCGIIQPKIAVDLAAAGQTRYTRVFAGQGGIDPYGGMTGDIYQNMFGAGSFAGKGLIDVDAYLACLDDRFPENAVLSHDLLEGAYLRCAFAGDIELTDGYPARPSTYYDRMHRWTRGDWQALPWLMRRVRRADGHLAENVLGQLDRWKIADNLRRSLVPVFSFAALAAGILLNGRDFLYVALVAVLAIVSHLVIASAVEIFNKNRCRIRYQSSVVPGFAGQLAQTLIRLVFLPYEAWVCLSAVVTALFRMYVSRRRLLAWVTAADTERKTKNTAVHVLLRMWPALAVSLLLAAFAAGLVGAAVAAVWVLSPLLVAFLSRGRRLPEAPDGEEKRFLTRCAADIWRYFEELMTAEEHHLPPDNYQEQPAVGVAHRTSPTNIGMALLSALAACDLGVCFKDRAMAAIGRIFDTVEGLPKWNGHLYNWYDTLTLHILQPAYVSTVDSGNLAGCLIALREGLSELGEKSLSERADALLRDMCFTQLFDRKRQLFYIGWDVSKDAPTEGWYDLLASEARQASYIAIARGDIPRKHWRRLGRSLVSMDGYRGMASWTGTMFEYLMPELLLPCYENSLLYESLRFCLYVQKKSAGGRPWGMSESAFYAFDHTLSYRYKAHGAQRLALKRGMGRETVVSPYSTFLALGLDRKAAVQNLRRLSGLGMEGRYGFYEAADFTPERRRSAPCELVKTFMSHHLGMSIVAIDNVLRGNIMQRRFMRDREMASYAELLQERLPSGGVILRQLPRDVPEKPSRLVSELWRFQGSGIDYRNPRCTLLGNGAYTVFAAETGKTASLWNGVALTKTSFETAGDGMGMAFFLRCGDELVSLMPSPAFDRNVRYTSELTGACCRIDAKSGSLSSSVSAAVPESDAGELRVVEITSDVERTAELVCYFEPVLSRMGDYASHPAFSKLSLETSLVEGALIVRRRPRAKGQGLTLAFDCDSPFEFDTSREAALGRGGLSALGRALARPAGGSLGSVLDPCVLARVGLTLRPGEPCRVSFALATASRPDVAASAARRILLGGLPSHSRLDETARRLRLPPERLESAMALLPELLFPSPDRLLDAEARAHLGRGQKSLWSLGVSGDLPIVAVDVEDAEGIGGAAELVPVHRFLEECGVGFDLVYLLRGGGDYRSTLRDAMLEKLRGSGCEGRLGARGGIHLADASAEGAGTARAAAVRVVSGEKPLSTHPRDEEYAPLPRLFNQAGDGPPPPHRYDGDNSFTFDVRGRLPLNTWSHMLANEDFGYIATDAGTGHMWHQNARENKINRWYNDSLSTQGTERLAVIRDGVPVSLFAGEDGHDCTVTYGFGWARWKKTIGGDVFVTTAFVPPGCPARIFIVTAEGQADFEISYFTDLVLAPDENQSVFVETDTVPGGLSAKNPYNADFPDTVFYLLASQTPAAFTCARDSWLAGRFDGFTGAGVVPCAAALYKPDKALVLVAGCGDPEELRRLTGFKEAASALKETVEHWRKITSRLTVRTPSADLDSYLNGWAVYQTVACRIFGRSSVYQSGGAYGYRDQLQDVCALVGDVPELVRRHLVRAAGHQFEEGDVQHWWHPDGTDGAAGDKGVRTRCSDDLLWLPYALCTYAEKTGDTSVFDIPAGYISSPPLLIDEHERYEHPKKSALTEPLLAHAIRAVNLVLERGVGRNGLCLIGTGDWNDGMNLVGAQGDGESVWLTWFTSVTAKKMARACLKAGNPGAATRFEEAAARLMEAAENAWDGAWYKRGYYDDGTPLGSCHSDECHIDSIAQSFAALAGADPDRARQALTVCVERLFDRDDRVVRLFDPPFSAGRSMPGYIKGYSPGFRENGGQYTHGAVWLAMGLFLAGMTDTGWEVLSALLPQGRKDDVYRTEPYVLAADVYSAPGHLGRGGWSWYTGASGWFRRVAVENLLGLRFVDGVLHIRPRLPSGWEGFEAEVESGPSSYRIRVDADGRVDVEYGGEPVTEGFVLEDGGDTPEC